MTASFRVWLSIALAAGIAAAMPVAAVTADPIRGRAVVLDGDTLEVGHLRIRLFGIDAPELDQTCWTTDGEAWPCGIVARDRIAGLVADTEVGCQPRERDNYGRLIARCSVGGQDLGATLIAEGLAWAYLRFSRRYADGEAAAREAGVGLWQGEAQAAWHYRAGPWTPASGRAPTADVEPEREENAVRVVAVVPAGAPLEGAGAPAGCSIKGNISARGERVYHVPGSRWYARTVIETGTGERWFCDAGEAEAAGWRPAAGSR